jgi:hypothetical protein
MGCDIHSKVEVKKDGIWEINTDKVFKNNYYLSDEKLEKRRVEQPNYNRMDFQEIEFQEHPTDGRNYDWFAILADVRNGSGFAGTDTGDGFVPIDYPRGVPDDATQEWLDYVEDWGMDLHSMSWLTLEDFLNYNWDRKTKMRGVVSLNQYKELKGTNNTPNTWSGFISGPNIITVPAWVADIVLTGEIYPYTYQPKPWEKTLEAVKLSLDCEYNIHVTYEWEVDYKEWFEYKIEEYVKPMMKLKEKYGDVRLVFGFDN